MTSLIISRLIEKGFKVYIPLHRSHIIVVQGIDGALKRCELQNASIDKDRAPIARGFKESAELLGVVDGVTQTVWLIPADHIEGRQALRLGKRYEEYIIPEPQSLSYQEQKEKRAGILDELKNAARDLGAKGVL